eukprot:1996026-Rhodomonas_salina.2
MSEFQSLPPSKVLHIRNLPEECNEMDIRTLASQYGEVHRSACPCALGAVSCTEFSCDAPQSAAPLAQASGSDSYRPLNMFLSVRG